MTICPSPLDADHVQAGTRADPCVGECLVRERGRERHVEEINALAQEDEHAVDDTDVEWKEFNVSPALRGLVPDPLAAMQLEDFVLCDPLTVLAGDPSLDRFHHGHRETARADL